MKRRDIIFCIGILISVFFVHKIPINFVFEGLSPVYLVKVKTIVFGSLIIGGCIWIAVWKKILSQGGFVHSNWKNSFLLVIPLVFPGALFISGLDISCFNDPVFSMVTIASIFIPAMMEEILLRGVIQGYIVSRYPQMRVHHICLLSAAFFSLMHLSNLRYADLVGVLQQMVYAFYTGLVFAVLLFKTRNVWLNGLLHGVLNFFSYRCEDDLMSLQNDQQPSLTLTPEDLANIGREMLYLAPILLIYWFLVKTTRSPHHVEEADSNKPT